MNLNWGDEKGQYGQYRGELMRSGVANSRDVPNPPTHPPPPVPGALSARPTLESEVSWFSPV